MFTFHFHLFNVLPLIRQTEAAECGLACIGMIAGYHGLDTDMTTLRRRFGLSMKGATLEDLIATAQALDLTTRALRCEPEDFSQLRLPAILNWEFRHFVVLKAVTSYASVGGVVEDAVVNFENITGGSGNDVLAGDGLGNLLDGGSGNDMLLGLGGEDLLVGGAGADTLDGGLGSDTAGFADQILPVVVTLNGATDAIVRCYAQRQHHRGADGEMVVGRAGEFNERFAVTLSGPSTGASLGVATAGGLIWNDDISLSIMANKAAVAEGNAGSTAFGFTVTRAGAATGATEVSWAILPGAADAADFAGGVMPQGKITFAAGQTAIPLVVQVAGDVVPEPDELFTVVLYGASGGAVIGTMSASAAILTDDAITGTAGGELLMGSTSNDLFVLAGGLDTVIGGAGVDRFVFGPATLGAAAAQAVALADLDRSLGEVIDLGPINAIAATLANDAFSFIGGAAFSGVAGQLRWAESAGERLIEGDVNGDRVADLTIRTPALGPVGADWFVL